MVKMITMQFWILNNAWETIAVGNHNKICLIFKIYNNKTGIFILYFLKYMIWFKSQSGKKGLIEL